MKVYEFGERCKHEGMLWSDLVIDDDRSFEAIKTALVAKFELNISLTVDALDEDNDGFDDYDYINDHLEQKEYDLSRLDLARKAQTLEELWNIDRVFVRQRNVSEYVGCDYWSLLASETVSKTLNN